MSDGWRYLGYLFEHPNESFTCLELYRTTHPGAEEAIGQAVWTEPGMDKKTRDEFLRELNEARESVNHAENDPTMPENEVQAARDHLDQLQGQANKFLDAKGKSRPIVEGDRGKARQNVRKALDVVLEVVATQSNDVERVLRPSLGKGKDIAFIPPPDWDV